MASQAHIVMSRGFMCFVHRCAFIHDHFLHSLQQSKPVLSVTLVTHVVGYFSFYFIIINVHPLPI